MSNSKTDVICGLPPRRRTSTAPAFRSPSRRQTARGPSSTPLSLPPRRVPSDMRPHPANAGEHGSPVAHARSLPWAKHETHVLKLAPGLWRPKAEREIDALACWRHRIDLPCPVPRLTPHGADRADSSRETRKCRGACCESDPARQPFAVAPAALRAQGGHVDPCAGRRRRMPCLAARSRTFRFAARCRHRVLAGPRNDCCANLRLPRRPQIPRPKRANTRSRPSRRMMPVRLGPTLVPVSAKRAAAW